MKPNLWRRSRAGKYLRHIPRLKHLRGTWVHRRFGDRLFSPDLWQLERQKFAGGMAVGLFFSMIPMPFQMLPSITLAYFTRVNIPAAIAGVWISNPLTTPIIIYIQYKIGRWILGAQFRPASVDESSWLDLLTKAPLAILIGGVITGMILCIIGYPITLKLWDVITGWIERSRRKNPPQDFRAD